MSDGDGVMSYEKGLMGLHGPWTFSPCVHQSNHSRYDVEQRRRAVPGLCDERAILIVWLTPVEVCIGGPPVAPMGV